MQLLVQIIIDFLQELKKPLLTNDEMEALCDISTSSAVDRAHLGLMTGLADLISCLLYVEPRSPSNDKTQVQTGSIIKEDESFM